MITLKKVELLSPAGNMECLKAAIAAGCDAVYLGGKMFGARAFSNNFNDEELIEAIKCAHIYGVRVYVTVNTIIYEHEVDRFMKYVDFLYKNNVDALIIQDIGMMDLIRKTYPNLELHASTQMHIHNIEGVKLVEKLGLKRVVLARETNIETIKYIKENTNIDLEIFVQGALCISYSGQCLMSALIGNRSGNRGSCAGSCRQKYNLIVDNKKVNEEEYLLSTKDLCALEDIGKLIDLGFLSFKIEGRMKSKEYVYMATKIYREAIDSYLENKTVNLKDLDKLKLLFNRKYTKGFLFNEENITNSYRPNHLGVEIGKVIKKSNNMITIKLTNDLSINDGIRIVEDDYGFIITKMFKNKNKINKAHKNDIIDIPCNNKITINSKAVKTTDYNLIKKIDELILKNKKIFISSKLIAKIGFPLTLEITDSKNVVKVEGNIVEKSINSPISKTRINEQISKLGHTPYKIDKLDIISDDNIFISIKELNDLKNNCINLLNEKRLYKNDYIKQEYKIDLKDYPQEKNYNIYISNIEQYNKIKKHNFKYIYVDDTLYDKIDDKRKILKLERVNSNYKNNNNVLIGELGGINENVYSDWSLNVVNSYSVAFLHNLGVNQVCLSYELTDTQINNLINAYYQRYNKKPNLELIVYGKQEAMISKFNLNKLYNVKNSYLQDRFNNLYPIREVNGLMKIYNYKPLDLKDKEKYFDMGINNIRYNLLDEDVDKRWLNNC